MSEAVARAILIFVASVGAAGSIFLSVIGLVAAEPGSVTAVRHSGLVLVPLAGVWGAVFRHYWLVPVTLFIAAGLVFWLDPAFYGLWLAYGALVLLSLLPVRSSY